MVSSTHEQNSICSQKKLNDIAHEHTIICRQLFAGHMVDSRPMKRKKHLHRMISANIQRTQEHIQSEVFSVTRQQLTVRISKSKPQDVTLFLIQIIRHELLKEQLNTNTRATNITHTDNIVKIANIVICIEDCL